MLPDNIKDHSATGGNQLNFVRGVVERAYRENNSIVFYVGNQAIEIAKNPTTYNLDIQNSNGKVKMKFRIAMPGPQAFTYCAQRIIESYPSYAHTFFPSHVYTDDTQERMDADMDSEPDNC